MSERPTRPAVDPRGHLRARMKAIADRAERLRKEHRIVYRVAGGPPTRRLEYTLEISGTGSVTCRYLDELQDRRTRTFRSRLSPDKAIGLFRELVESRLLETADSSGGFLPDSVVGSVTIADGVAEITYRFLADERQRHDQGLELNPSLARIHRMLQRQTDRVVHKKARDMKEQPHNA